MGMLAQKIHFVGAVVMSNRYGGSSNVVISSVMNTTEGTTSVNVSSAGNAYPAIMTISNYELYLNAVWFE